MTRRDLLVSGGVATLVGLLPRAVAAAPVDAPPVARVEPVTETLFGVAVTDRYRWMENSQDKDWAPYLKGQDEFARRLLDRIPGRAALVKRVGELSGDLERVNAFSRGGPYTFVEKRPAGANNFQLFVRDAAGTERLLIDPEKRTQGEVHYSINFWSASPDGNHVLYGISASGSEDAVIEIMETATGKILPDRIDRTQYAYPSWLPDSSAFFFNRLADGAKRGATDYYKNSVNWLHKVGTDARKDIKVLARGQFADVPVDEIDFPIVVAQPGSDYVFGVLYAGVQTEISIYVNKLTAAKKGEGGWKKICTAADKVTGGTFVGDDIYLITYANAPRYKLLHVKASAPAVANASEVVPQDKSVIQNVFSAKDGVYLQWLDGGVGRISKLDATGKSIPVVLPFEGAIGTPYADTLNDGLLLALESWVRPAQVVQIDKSGAVSDTGLVAKPKIDVSAFESTRLFATARDGIKIPLSVVYKKGLKKNGSAPAIVEAYGSYGMTSDPYFSPRHIAWLEQGGIWATAHVRGGGEYGREWYEQGKSLNKPNTWRDLIACCEALIADGWTHAKRLTILGVSAGGIAVGRAMTERPDLFAAVVSEVGLLNSLRGEFEQNGPPNIPEYGTVMDEKGFKALYEMDAYQHVVDGTKYPAVLITTGVTDPRVDPWNAGKMAARLQIASTSGRPIILRVEFQAGHGFGSTRQQRDQEDGDIFAFARWQAGA